MDYRRDIDGLRALAVLPVILFHAGFETFRGGFVGVDVFFVISGYLITSIIVAELATGDFSFATFYERRARRILPALVFVVLASIPAAWIWMLPDEFVEFGKSMLGIAVFSSNFYFRAETDYFGVAAEEKPLLHTWSLAVEEQYYFVFPLLLWIVWRFGRARVGLVLGLLAVGSLAFAESRIQLTPDQIFFDTRGRIWEILAGALVALHLSNPHRRAFRPLVHHLGSALGLALIVYAIVAFDESTESPGLSLLIPVLGTALVILFSTPTTVTGRILGTKPLVAIGLTSYSAYLWHQPILAFTRLRNPEEPTAITLSIASLLALALAYPTWRFIEQPFRDRSRIGRQAIVTFAIVATATIATLGAVIVHQDGFMHRFGRDSATAQTFAELQAERAEITRSGECQYNPKTAINSFDLFVKTWRCDEDPERPELKKIGVIVAGDSHSADIASALRTNGLSPVQIGAPGCSVVPSRMSKGCRKIFTFIRNFAENRPEYTHIVLANRWDKTEVSESQLRTMVDFWKLPGKTLVFVTSRPEFIGYKRALHLGLPLRASMSRAETSSAPSVVSFLERAEVPVIDAGRIFCSLTPTCSWKDSSGRYLTTDGHHFSRLGAQLFGEKMLALGIIPTTPLHEADR